MSGGVFVGNNGSVLSGIAQSRYFLIPVTTHKLVTTCGNKAMSEQSGPQTLLAMHARKGLGNNLARKCPD